MDISYPDVIHTFYDRPALLGLAELNLTGKRVLDLGSSSGSLTSCFIERGAQVIAVDSNAGAIAVAERTLGSRARLHVADISSGVPFIDDQSIDLVSASLVLDHIGDWTALLADVHRVLKPGTGRFIASLHHPDWDRWDEPTDTDRPALERFDETLTVAGASVDRTIHRRPRSEVESAFAKSSLKVESLFEPEPLKTLELFRPRAYEHILLHPWFLVVSAHRPNDASTD